MADTVQTLKKRISRLEARLEAMERERRDYLQDRALIALLSDGDNQRLDAGVFEQISGVAFHGNRFVLLAFTDHSSEPGTRDEAPVWESLNSTYYRVLSRLIVPCFSEMEAFMTANFNGCIFGLANLPDSLSPEDYRRVFTDIGAAVNRAVEAAEGFRFQIAISPIGYGRETLPELRRNTEMLLEYWNIMGDVLPEVLFYQDAAYSEKELQAVESRQTNEQFSDYINRGDFDRAKDFFHREILGEFLDNHISATLLRFRIAAMMDYMLQTLSRASQELGLGQVLEETGALEHLLNAATLDDISRQMDGILDALSCQWKTAGTANQQLARRARAYIDENYHNRDLNVNMLAEFLQVSPSHVTRVFRGCYGIRALDYIQQVRIRAAKGLLSRGMTLKEIADQVGYGAQINMIRAFKRLEGKTPSEFGLSEEPTHRGL